MPRPAGPCLSRPVWICRSCLTRPKAGISTPVSLGNLRASIDVEATKPGNYSSECGCSFTGNDPILRDEYVVFSAHHDHLGVGAAVNGDSIYNGALG